MRFRVYGFSKRFPITQTCSAIFFVRFLQPPLSGVCLALIRSPKAVGRSMLPISQSMLRYLHGQRPPFGWRDSIFSRRLYVVLRYCVSSKSDLCGCFQGLPTPSFVVGFANSIYGISRPP